MGFFDVKSVEWKVRPLISSRVILSGQPHSKKWNICFHSTYRSVFHSPGDLFVCVHLASLSLIRLVQSSPQPGGTPALSHTQMFCSVSLSSHIFFTVLHSES